jgi:hypothetical protein
MPSEVQDRLIALEEVLRPKDLVNQVRGVVLESRGCVDLDDVDDVKGSYARMNATVERLGKDVGSNFVAFRALLPDLVRGSSRLPLFGASLAGTAEAPYEIWCGFVAEFAATTNADTRFLRGFLEGLQNRDGALADALLDEALEHPALAPHFPELQTSVVIDERGVERLHRALELGKAPITQFYALAYGRASDNIPGPAFRDLLLAIGAKPGGMPVALEILSMRLYSDKSDKRESVPEVAEAGRALLDAYKFHKRDSNIDREDRELGRIVETSLQGAEGIPIVQRLVRNVMAAINRNDIYAHDQDDLITGLLHVHPTVVLDERFSGNAKARRRAAQAFGDLLRFHKNPLDVVPEKVVLDWADVDPAVRYPLIAASATLFRRPKDGEAHEWTPLTAKLLELPTRARSSRKSFIVSIR